VAKLDALDGLGLNTIYLSLFRYLGRGTNPGRVAYETDSDDRC